ncbi:glycosyltransferase family 4 protein [Bosea sp. ASV33]|uniref:glycosyltransferase family 4 protein n=1 Tax=Bosea sp. ASV33 TaxID=2795106 RepID=UPI0020BE2C47|nr:glycosyltransferase family 4 protein [Bosea sp. ASV33]
MFVNTLYPPNIIGGAEVSVALLAKALANRGIDIGVVTFHDSAEEATEIVEGVKVHRVPLDNVYWPFGLTHRPSPLKRLRWHANDIWNGSAAARFGRILDRERPEVVHTHNLIGFSSALWSEPKKRGMPLVHTLRDYTAICKRSTLFTRGRTCEQRCGACAAMTAGFRLGAPEVDAVISNSRYMLETHTRRGYFSNARQAVIRNIVNMGEAGQGAQDEDVVFGYIGRVEDEKGIEVVLEATRRLPSTGWRLRIAGRGIETYVEALKGRYVDPRIEWLGFTRPAEFYASIDVCLVSSVWPEPLPRTLIESIGAGRATICSTAGGIPEIAEQSALIGTYAPRDHARLAELMATAINDRAKWRGSHPASQEVRQMFSADTIARAHMDIYDDVKVRRSG